MTDLSLSVDGANNVVDPIDNIVGLSSHLVELWFVASAMAQWWNACTKQTLRLKSRKWVLKMMM